MKNYFTRFPPWVRTTYSLSCSGQSSSFPLRSSATSVVNSFLPLPKTKKAQPEGCAVPQFPDPRLFPYQNSTPQKSSPGLSNRKPNSHPALPSCPRQIISATASAPFTGFFSRNFCPTPNPCGTIARHPLVLTSMVYPSTVC